MKYPKRLILKAVVLSLALFLAPAGNISPVAAAPQDSANEPCELPPAPLTGGAASGSNLVITCLRLDKTHYTQDENWTASLLVTNLGSTASGDFNVLGKFCRLLMDGTNEACENVFIFGGEQTPLLSGQSRVIQSTSQVLAPIPSDLSPNYDSWIPGIPDNGTILLKATIDDSTMITEAIYPSAPSNINGASDPAFVDVDGDGWSPEVGANAPYSGIDCADELPNVHPGANEIAGNGLDDDCHGGDVPSFTAIGCSGPVEVYYSQSQSDPCSEPPGSQQAPYVDFDGDGFVSPGLSFTLDDCNDTNSLVYPNAPEINDGFDNNCNGLIDELFAIPDWAITLYNVTADIEIYSGNYFVPGLRYLVEIANVGEDLGDDFSTIENSVWQFNNYVNPFQIEASGLEGFIPYSQLGLGGGNYVPCSSYTPIAMISMVGLYGETVFGNNLATVNLSGSGPSDRSLHFGSPPELIYESDNSISIEKNIEITGSCPPLPVSSEGSEVIMVHRRVIFNSATILDLILTSPVGQINFSAPISLPSSDPLERGDVVCIEIGLDPFGHVGEDHSDNNYYQAWEFKNPLIGAKRFDKIWEASGPALLITYPPSFNCNPPASTDSALSGGLNGLLINGMPLNNALLFSNGMPFNNATILFNGMPFNNAALSNGIPRSAPGFNATDDCPTPTPKSQAQPNIGQSGQVAPQQLGDDPCEPPGEDDASAESPPGLAPDLCLIGPECFVGGIPTGALIGMLLVGTVGFFGGRLLASRLKLAKGIATTVMVTSTIGGAVVGMFIGGQVQLAGEQVQPVRIVDNIIGDFGLPSCDAFLDPTSAYPSNFTTFEANNAGLISPNYTPIMLSIDLVPNYFMPVSSQFLVVIAAPTSQNASLFIAIPKMAALERDGPALIQIEPGQSLNVDLSQALLDMGAPEFFSQPGEYRWHFTLGQGATGGDLVLFQTFCQGSTVNSFIIGEAGDVPSESEDEVEETGPGTPTPTSTVVFLTPTMTPFIPTPTFTAFKATPTYTSTPPADNSPPSVQGMNASPNPTLTTVPITVSATITDLSGVMNVILYYSVAKGPYQFAGNMSPSGGNNYSLTFGPLTPAGTYTFKILAQDNQGNVTCTSSTLGSCPGGTFVVNIP